jgi:hypothetical protein
VHDTRAHTHARLPEEAHVAGLSEQLAETYRPISQNKQVSFPSHLTTVGPPPLSSPSSARERLVDIYGADLSRQLDALLKQVRKEEKRSGMERRAGKDAGCPLLGMRSRGGRPATNASTPLPRTPRLLLLQTVAID